MTEGTDRSQSPIDQVRAQLRPLFQAVIQRLTEEGEQTGVRFFMETLALLDESEDEEGLLYMSLNLSRAAFVSIAYSEASWRLTDELLESAQNIAHAFTADDERPH